MTGANELATGRRSRGGLPAHPGAPGAAANGLRPARGRTHRGGAGAARRPARSCAFAAGHRAGIRRPAPPAPRRALGALQPGLTAVRAQARCCIDCSASQLRGDRPCILTHTVYEATAKWCPDRPCAGHLAGTARESTTPPPQFDGPEGSWSPETLLCASVADCLILTFRAIARASKFEWQRISCRVEGTLEKVEGSSRFTGFISHVTLHVPAGTDAARAKLLLEKSEHGCLVANSLDRQTRTGGRNHRATERTGPHERGDIQGGVPARRRDQPRAARASGRESALRRVSCSDSFRRSPSSSIPRVSTDT